MYHRSAANESFTRKQPANQSPVANFGDSGFVHHKYIYIRNGLTIEVLQTKDFTRKQPANQNPVANFGDSGFVHHKERPYDPSGTLAQKSRLVRKTGPSRMDGFRTKITIFFARSASYR